MLTTQKIRQQCSAAEMQKYVGFKYYPDKCIGAECKRKGNHADHVWEDEIIVVDKRIRKRNGHEEEYSAPIRWYNFQYSLFIKKDNIREAIKYNKENCFDLAGEPEYMPAKLGFLNYSKLLQYIQEAEQNAPFALVATN